MTLDKWIALISSLAGSISAIAALFAIRQSILQRTTSYKPQLVLNNTTLHAEIKDFKQLAISNKITIEQPPLIANNIGLGTAINVRYKWLYAYTEIANKLNHEISEFFNLKPSDYDFETKHHCFIISTKTSISVSTLLSDYQEISHILSYDIQKEGTTLKTPTIGIILSINKLFYEAISINESQLWVEGPKLIIEYYDIGGRKYNEEWCSILRLKSGEFSDTVKAEINLELKKIHNSKTVNRLQKIRKSYADFISDHDFNKNRWL